MPSIETYPATGGSRPMTLAEHLNPFFARHVTLDTALTPSQCEATLLAVAEPEWRFWWKRKEFCGSVGPAGFAVYRLRGMRRSHPLEARGSFTQGGAGGRGTRVEVEMGWRRLDAIATVLGLVGAQVALLVARAAAGSPPAWVPWVMIPFVVLALAVSALTTMGEDERLRMRLVTLFEATDVTPTS